MTTDFIRLRNEFINSQVITRNTGKRLGVVKELLVDIDQREVVALGLKDSMLSVSGMPRYMYLSSICKSGDVILVEDEDVIADVDIDAYSNLINSEVITETGEPLGRVRDFQFNLEDGTVSSLIIASLGLPQIPDQMISTYELPIDEVISSGPNRLIVFEGAEDRISQLTVGFLERLGIGRPPWERDQEETYYAPTAKPENQLGTGIPVRATAPPPPVQTRVPVVEENWDEDEWEEVPAVPVPRQAESIRYQEAELEGDNWGETGRDRGQPRYEQPYQPSARQSSYDYQYEYDDINEDVWHEQSGDPSYKAPRVNISEKTKTPEYEEETNY